MHLLSYLLELPGQDALERMSTLVCAGRGGWLTLRDRVLELTAPMGSRTSCWWKVQHPHQVSTEGGRRKENMSNNIFYITDWTLPSHRQLLFLTRKRQKPTPRCLSEVWLLALAKEVLLCFSQGRLLAGKTRQQDSALSVSGLSFLQLKFTSSLGIFWSSFNQRRS
jgi:hypothetical protein